MKQIKVSLYTREPISRRYRKVKRNKDYPSTTTFVLRYGGRRATDSGRNPTDVVAVAWVMVKLSICVLLEPV